MASAKRWSARIGHAVSANPDYADKRSLDNGNRRGDRGYRCQPFSVHALGRGYSYLGLKPSTASWPAILPNTKARSID
ncbi:MAG: hypothetical protein WB390_06530, partial [Pseudolabrys sp.]